MLLCFLWGGKGTAIATKHGMVKTDPILFIASGAFHLAKPSDLIPELQGCLPIRVEWQALSMQDFEAIRISTHALVIQYLALLPRRDGAAVGRDELRCARPVGADREPGR